jgi:hypothetical protein
MVHASCCHFDALAFHAVDRADMLAVRTFHFHLLFDLGCLDHTDPLSHLDLRWLEVHPIILATTPAVLCSNSLFR